MRARFVAVISLVALFGLSACGTIQYREGRGTFCRADTRCPYEVN